jgi:hypothetical protein
MSLRPPQSAREGGYRVPIGFSEFRRRAFRRQHTMPRLTTASRHDTTALADVALGDRRPI